MRRCCPDFQSAGLDICSHQHPDLQSKNTQKSWTQERYCCPGSPTERRGYWEVTGGWHTACYHTEVCLFWDLARFCRDPITAPNPDHHTSCFMERSADCKVWKTKVQVLQGRVLHHRFCKHSDQLMIWVLTLEAILVEVSSCSHRHTKCWPSRTSQNHTGLRTKQTPFVHIDINCPAGLLLTVKVKRSAHQQVIPPAEKRQKSSHPGQVQPFWIRWPSLKSFLN